MEIENCWYKGKCKNKCSDSCVRFKLVKSLFNLSELPKHLWEYKKLLADEDLGAFNKLNEISQNILDFVECGRQLYIWSDNCGNGKTSWAVRLMWSYFDKVWHTSSFDCKAVFVNVQKFLHDSKSNINYKVDGYDELCEKIKHAELVVWDDLPCAQFTDYEHQLLFQFIDNRVNAGQANIITGNEDRNGCIDKLGDKLCSRIFCDYVVEFVEGDKRGIKDGSTANNK